MSVQTRREITNEDRRAAYQKMEGDIKAIFYYIIVLHEGNFSFRDLFGQSDNVNAIFDTLRADGSQFDVIASHMGGGYIDNYAEYKAMFEEEIAAGTYIAPKFGRQSFW